MYDYRDLLCDRVLRHGRDYAEAAENYSLGVDCLIVRLHHWESMMEAWRADRMDRDLMEEDKAFLGKPPQAVHPVLQNHANAGMADTGEHAREILAVEHLGPFRTCFVA